MDKYTEFKIAIQCRMQDIEQETGYSRPGIVKGFFLLQDGKASRRFVIALNSMIDRRILKEEARHLEQLAKLNRAKIMIHN